MAEYIEREALRRKLYDADAITMIGLKLLDYFPSADVQLVVHGRWIDGDSRCVTAVCSKCNHLRLGNGAKSATRLALYCERCGARMDGEEDG